jgi:hypothetical protein
MARSKAGRLAQCPGSRIAVQYDARRDSEGWTVFDRWTGKTVVLTGVAQIGLAWLEADDLADRLNHRGQGGDRRVLQ